jgi:hypothetical protein
MDLIKMKDYEKDSAYTNALKQLERTIEEQRRAQYTHTLQC